MGESARRKQQCEADFKEVDARLRSDGVDTSKLGFYDQDAFLAQEKANPAYSKFCTRWLARRPMSDSYREFAQRAVLVLADAVSQLFADSDMEASCLNGSAMLSRVLERAGVWNHVIHGSFVLEVPHKGIWRGFGTVDEEDFPGAVRGHAWVYAPPFHVVDLTIAQQRWDKEAMPFVPEKVLHTFTARATVEVRDIVAARVQRRLRQHPLWGKRELVYVLEGELAEMELLVAPVELRVGEAVLRYIPVATRLPDTDLEPMNQHPKCTGPTGAEVWAHCRDLVAELRG